MGVKLVYNFIDEPWFDKRDGILVTMPNFEYNVDDEGDYDFLLEKYRGEALTAAANEQLLEYANFLQSMVDD